MAQAASPVIRLAQLSSLEITLALLALIHR